MKIKVRGIPESGLEVKKSIEPAEIGLGEEDADCLSPVEMIAKVEKAQNIVIAHVEVAITLSCSCSRCLEGVEYPFSAEYKFDYEVDKNTEFIDIGEDIRQEIILGLPTKILCRDDCRGICLHCGANLNEEECGCSR